jgi:FAD synthase
VVAYRLTAGVAQKRVRELALDTSNLVWTSHIEERMEARGIDTDAVLRILREGDVEEEPCAGEKQGDWKIKVVRKMGNGRTAGVVTVLVDCTRLILITAQWEDRR